MNTEKKTNQEVDFTIENSQLPEGRWGGMGERGEGDYACTYDDEHGVMHRTADCYTVHLQLIQHCMLSVLGEGREREEKQNPVGIYSHIHIRQALVYTKPFMAILRKDQPAHSPDLTET